MQLAAEVNRGNAPLKREEIKTEDEPSQAFRERLEEANNVLRHRQRSEGPVVGAGAAVADPVRAIKPEPTDTLPGAVNDGGVLKQEEDGGMSKLPFIKPEPEDAPMPPPRTPIKRIEPDSTPRRVEEGGQDLKPSVKPEPVDVPMPRPRAPNKRMDPFEPEATPSIVVKQEAGREFNTRQPPPGTAHPPSAYLRAPTPRIKQEERVSYPHAQRTASRPYYADPRQQSGFGRQEYGYGGTVNRASWQPPAPISFPRGDSDPSKTNHNSSYSNRRTPGASYCYLFVIFVEINVAPHNYSAPAREDTRSYSRQPSRTFSPPPRPVKRERDADDDSRPYRPAYEPPVKRERSESTDIRFNYSASHDPRMRARLGDQRERDASKRTKTE
ncbi:hypothetical protein B0H17DRAFT_1086776 [Mycena rosella]|uniref:Uncharacterized protein n=1 Tax=Mycena rosella TaxID=1033263 RepID=A0AAD7CYB6_MYCRO|nr:hypothetical protein B0H17DRAFT_1086776 [Mycena rosella]